MNLLSWTTRRIIGGCGERLAVQTDAGVTIVEPEFDLDSRNLRHVAGPELDEHTVDELWADYERLQANDHGVPVRPKHFVRRLEVA